MRLKSTLVRPKLINSPTLMPVALSSLQLCFVSRIVVLGDLQFDDDAFLNQQVRLVIADDDSLVNDLDLPFQFRLHPDSIQLDLQCLLIDALQEPVSQNLVHFKRRPNDLLRYLFEEKLICHSESSVFFSLSVFNLCFICGRNLTA